MVKRGASKETRNWRKGYNDCGSRCGECFSHKKDPVFSGSFSQNQKTGTEIGTKSHAEGHQCTASSNFSHAEGCSCTAQGRNQHIQGKYNIASGTSNSIVDSDYAHIALGTEQATVNAQTPILWHVAVFLGIKVVRSLAARQWTMVRRPSWQTVIKRLSSHLLRLTAQRNSESP